MKKMINCVKENMNIRNHNHFRRNGTRLLVFLLISALSAANLICYADESTSTGYTAAKDLSANPSIYVETTDQSGSDYVYFGQQNEPKDGVYVGVTVEGGVLPDGGYGAVNGDLVNEGSLVSFYTSLNDPYSLQYWSYIYGPYIGKERGLVIYMNFDFDGGDLDKVNSGVYDEKLIQDFQYLHTLDCPVYMRVGGEMTFDGISASGYKKAFRHISGLSDEYAPEVALVFSPNYSSSVGTDMDDYYPGDDVVDWVGASLYYNKYALSGDRVRDSFYGVGLYGDAVLNAQQIVNLSRMHSKPVMITEGGSAWYQQGEDTTEFAADRVMKAMTYLTMVYPEIKAIVYSDTNYTSTELKFSLSENETVKNAYLYGLENNPTYAKTISEGNDGKGGYYTKLGSNSGTWSGAVTLCGYTYSGNAYSAEWYLDGTKDKTSSTYPFRYTLDTGALDAGSHTVKVVFSSGATASTTFQVDSDSSTTSRFRDVMDPDVYYYDAIYEAVEQGIVHGVSDHYFDPYDSVRRADFICMLYRKAGSPEVSGDTPFNDVSESSYYADAVCWAVDNRITSGKTADTFDPNGNVSRAEAVTFLWRYCGSEKIASILSFGDVNGNAYYINAVKWGVKNHIVNGISSDTFAPSKSCTRCDAVCLMERI